MQKLKIKRFIGNCSVWFLSFSEINLFISYSFLQNISSCSFPPKIWNCICRNRSSWSWTSLFATYFLHVHVMWTNAFRTINLLDRASCCSCQYGRFTYSCWLRRQISLSFSQNHSWRMSFSGKFWINCSW